MKSIAFESPQSDGFLQFFDKMQVFEGGKKTTANIIQPVVLWSAIWWALCCEVLASHSAWSTEITNSTEGVSAEGRKVPSPSNWRTTTSKMWSKSPKILLQTKLMCSGTINPAQEFLRSILQGLHQPWKMGLLSLDTQLSTAKAQIIRAKFVAGKRVSRKIPGWKCDLCQWFCMVISAPGSKFISVARTWNIPLICLLCIYRTGPRAEFKRPP